MDPWYIVIESDDGFVAPEALAVARQLAGPSRTVVVRTRGTFALGGRHVVQPVSRGSTPAALLGLFHVLLRDPSARVAIFAGEIPLPLGDAVVDVIGSPTDGPCEPRLLAFRRGDARTPGELVVAGEAIALAEWIGRHAPEWYDALDRRVGSADPVGPEWTRLAPSDLHDDVLRMEIDAPERAAAAK